MKILKFSLLKNYHFQLKHLFVLFIVLIAFLIMVSFINKTSLQGLLLSTQDWYQRDSAERIANLTATSLELLLEIQAPQKNFIPEESQKIIQAFNIILNQQKLQQNIHDICILVRIDNEIIAIDNGQDLFDYYFNPYWDLSAFVPNPIHARAIHLYKTELEEKITRNEQIYSIPEGDQMFHVFVPFVPKGELVGAVYLKNTPDFTFITHEIISSFDETALIFASMIILGLLAMFYISSYTVKERDEAQQLLFQEREQFLVEKLDREKEALFTKRIYHTHHKAEKVMGFIKEDLRNLTCENIEETKYRVTRYANFVARVIYDMKWYDPPLQTIRNSMFRTDINEIIRFIVQFIFLRTSNQVNFTLTPDLDENLPSVPINEFVVWEILEPMIQNCIEHANVENLQIGIQTRFDVDKRQSFIYIRDNGCGVPQEFLEQNERGVKLLFLENVSSKDTKDNSGYGCYIAYEIATRRCGWKMDVENLAGGGCQFTLMISH